MNNFEKWKEAITVELAEKINKSIEGFDEEFERIPINEMDLKAWRKTDNLDEVSHLFSIDCMYCPVDQTEEGCPASDYCYEDFYEWAIGDSSWNEQRAEEIEAYNNSVNNHKQEIDRLMSIAEQGDAQVQYELGNNFLELGVLYYKKHDTDEALAEFQHAHIWFAKAAEQGNAQAQALLGNFYSQRHINLSIEKNDDTAIFWYTKAAEQGLILDSSQRSLLIEDILGRANNGDIEAQYQLGKLYLFGSLEEQNYTVQKSYQIEENDYDYAVGWLEKAAEQGHTGAQCTLGLCYYCGYRFTKENEKLAYRWFEEAAKQGYSIAQYFIGSFFKNGVYVELDNKQAFEWYEKAAEQGYADAQYKLGEFYSTMCADIGIPKDDDKATYWWKKAAEQGQTEAIYYLEEDSD
ncbi:MAG: sel1 repeat family protein [Oscillospiraceae bacterium]|nr:sel1 repeat family protein [Oscillospiraceae bacterium]